MLSVRPPPGTRTPICTRKAHMCSHAHTLTQSHTQKGAEEAPERGQAGSGWRLRGRQLTRGGKTDGLPAARNCRDSTSPSSWLTPASLQAVLRILSGKEGPQGSPFPGKVRDTPR